MTIETKELKISEELKGKVLIVIIHSPKSE